MNPTVLAEIEQGVVDCYAYIDALIETRRAEPGEQPHHRPDPGRGGR